MLDDAKIRETSGIVESRIRPGTFWAHPDSGNPPRLVAFDLTGKIIATVAIDAPNVDWEDITADDSGHLYIGDIGNFRGWLGVRQIYKIKEPDPQNPPASPIKPVQSWEYRYGNEDHFDAEALYWRKGSLYLISKTRGGRTLFRLDETENKRQLKLVRIAPMLSYVAPTGADCSPDGKRLFLCGNGRTGIVELTDSGAPDRTVRPRHISYPPVGGIEAIALYEDSVIIAAESGAVYKVPIDAIQRQQRYVSPPDRD